MSMFCSYAILKMTKYNIESLYESESKYYLLHIFIKDLLCSEGIKSEETTRGCIENSIISIIHERGSILYKDIDTIYVFCKFWERNCHSCNKYDLMPGKVYKIFSRRLCLDCTYLSLVPDLKGSSDRAISKEELLRQLLPTG